MRPTTTTSRPARSETDVRRQIAAMRSATFELLLLQFGEVTTANMMRVDEAALLRRVAWLRAQNASGQNINIRPTGTHLTLLDDLTASATKRMIDNGFQPCVVVETSPANFQAWLDHGRELTTDEATTAARMLATRFGAELAAAGRRHAGRLAGFTNRKPSRRLCSGLYPYVRLHIAAPRVYDRAPAFAAELRSALAAPVTLPRMPGRAYAATRLRQITDFHRDARYDGDLSRADFAYAIYAHAHGISDSKIEEAILTRDMRKKGNQTAQRRYALYTLRRAVIAQKKKSA